MSWSSVVITPPLPGARAPYSPPKRAASTLSRHPLFLNLESLSLTAFALSRSWRAGCPRSRRRPASLIPECHHRVDLRRPPRGDVAGERGDGEEQEHGQADRDRVGRRHPVEQTRGEARGRKRGGQP